MVTQHEITLLALGAAFGAYLVLLGQMLTDATLTRLRNQPVVVGRPAKPGETPNTKGKPVTTPVKSQV